MLAARAFEKVNFSHFPVHSVSKLKRLLERAHLRARRFCPVLDFSCIIIIISLYSYKDESGDVNSLQHTSSGSPCLSTQLPQPVSLLKQTEASATVYS